MFFEDNYKLISLKDLKLFLDKNKHLPDIPTTIEANRDGIRLGEINIKLLKKIEELTLYTINQEKVLNEQEHQISIQQKLIDELIKRIEKLENK